MDKIKQVLAGVLALLVIMPVIGLIAWLSFWMLLVIVIGVGGFIAFFTVVAVMRNATSLKIKVHNQ